jgi:hypothetical protein
MTTVYGLLSMKQIDDLSKSILDASYGVALVTAKGEIRKGMRRKHVYIHDTPFQSFLLTSDPRVGDILVVPMIDDILDIPACHEIYHRFGTNYTNAITKRIVEIDDEPLLVNNRRVIRASSSGWGNMIPLPYSMGSLANVQFIEIKPFDIANHCLLLATIAQSNISTPEGYESCAKQMRGSEWGVNTDLLFDPMRDLFAYIKRGWAKYRRVDELDKLIPVNRPPSYYHRIDKYLNEQNLLSYACKYGAPASCLQLILQKTRCSLDNVCVLFIYQV